MDKKIESPVCWHEYFFNIMKAAAMRSKDPNTKVGAVIVNSDKKIVGIGYNGFPPGIADLASRWEKPNKYIYTVHAELNAIFNSNEKVKGCEIYLPIWPCTDCAKNLIAAGITKIHVLSDYYKNEKTEEMLNECQIPIINHS